MYDSGFKPAIPGSIALHNSTLDLKATGIRVAI